MRRYWSGLVLAIALASCNSPGASSNSNTPAQAAAADPAGYVAWSSILPANITVPHGVTYSTATASTGTVALISNVPDAAVSTGRTDGVAVQLPVEFERQASGHQVSVTVRAAAAQGGMLGVAYSTSEVGNSGWRQFVLSSEPHDFTFTYDVPEMRAGNGDFLGFRSYGTGQVQVYGYAVQVGNSSAQLRTN